MSIPVPVKTPRKGPGSGRNPHPQPVLPPDDPNADRIDRESDIDPPPTDPEIKAPSEEPGTEGPPARACLWMTAALMQSSECHATHYRTAATH